MFARLRTLDWFVEWNGVTRGRWWFDYVIVGQENFVNLHVWAGRCHVVAGWERATGQAAWALERKENRLGAREMADASLWI